MHNKSTEQALKELGSSGKGLSDQEAESRLKEYGLNEIKESKKIPPWKIFLDQFKSVVLWILIAATLISAFLKEYIDAMVILIIIILIAVLGFILEYRAEKAIEALKKLSSLKATVIRNSQKREIDAKHLVPGDIISVETGNKVPADARLLEAFNLQAQEAALTGESQPVKKNTGTLPEKTAIADMKNMIFSGTVIVSGRANAIVAGTGMKSEIGKIATLIEEVRPEPTPLQKKMDKLGKFLGKVVIAVAVVIFAVGMLFHEKPLLDMLIFAVAVAVAAIPEALLAIVTMSLALGTQRMLKRNALIRRLPSVETLGSTTVICTDKTGTLTMNQMTVRKVFANGKIIDVTGSGYETKGQFLCKGKPVKTEEIEQLLLIGSLNNNSELKEGSVIGDPTEGSLIVSAEKAGIGKKDLDIEYPRTDEIEFTSERKLMTTLHSHHGEKLAFAKGAPEVILRLCSYILINGRVKKLAEKEKQKILDINREFANGALRVLGFAYKTIVTEKDPEKNLIFAGLQGMIDPARPEVKIAVEKCKNAGIKVVMITGDHEITARAVAKEIGLEGKSMTGQQLEEIKNLDEIVEEIAIFARVNPEHKIKIVDALKKKGHVVAMTGDGVNDAPALKKADIGIAMGITGTDVAKEASSMILLDDNFASIVNAVEEGRGVYDNIRKYIGFLLSGNIGEVLIIFLGIISGLPLVLTATQILLINLVTDGLPALALSADPFEPNAMSRKPRKQNESLFRGLNPFLIYYPVAQVAVALSIFIYIFFSEGNLAKAQTAAFLTIGMFELYQSIASRSTIYPVFKVGIFKNRLLILAFVSSFIIMAASIFIPSLGKHLDMHPIAIPMFLFIVAVSSIGAMIIEVCKHYKTRNEVIEINNG
ncbi:calcium-translocating P-type ATPase, PMCA-type [Candidatus Woesearchaeota archaeon]|nr:calcium-translocating P-type ATPase, PMCA-type [Candidatus Woesearchaeota archaeon]